MYELLSNEQMRRTDQLTIDAGTPGIELMRNAGLAVGRLALEMFPLTDQKPVIIFCGPGKNGGDGFIAGEWLRQQGKNVKLVFVGDLQQLQGDAALAAAAYQGEVIDYDRQMLLRAGGIIDALFGSGLGRPVEGAFAAIIEDINASALPVLAVDVPSGVDGDSGQVRGVAVKASQTITFFRYKPGHLLYPGQALCGQRTLAQIGIDDSALESSEDGLWRNHPNLWRKAYPLPRADGHKYDRGHALVISGGPWNTGAARLAAYAALRTGAGLVSLASSLQAAPINAAHLTAVMLKVFEDEAAFGSLLADPRRNAVLIGPAIGVNETTRTRVLDILSFEGKQVVLDADALSCFRDDPSVLFNAINKRQGDTVITPHDGEYQRLFADEADASDRLSRARHATRISGATVVLKGPDTVIASPCGRTAINVTASPWLATAGSGDVLAGIICGLLAQNMPAFEACCAATYLHGLAARHFGMGLIAEDLADQIPVVLKQLFDEKNMVKPTAVA